MSPSAESKKTNNGGTVLPVLALMTAQLFTSSWHVLGKHVMHQVPYLAPISYVLIRTLISSLILFIVGTIHEGYVPFPPLFRDGPSAISELSLQVGLLKPSSHHTSIQSGNSVGLSLSKSNSRESLKGTNKSGNGEKVDHITLASSLLQHKQHHHHRPRRRKRRRNPTVKDNAAILLRSLIPSISTLVHSIQHASKYYQQQIINLNPEAVQIIFAGLSGMLLLPVCYTTGLILTSPTVASVWDGPMIPLGCFAAAVALGLEERSTLYPFGQVGSLLLAVGGSIIVLLVDYLGGGGENRGDDSARGNGVNDHMQFIRGNLVLIGVVAAYSATALSQKQLAHQPPIQLTSWMFKIGFLGSLSLLLLDSILGGRITGCTLGQSLSQLYLALTTSPTFRYGLIYSAVFVGGGCFSINSYASSHLESSVITLFAAMQPPITAVLEWIWEGKGLGWKKLGGMVCVGIGMWFFTHIKRVEKDRVNGVHHHERTYAHSTKAQAHGKGIMQINQSIDSGGSLNTDHKNRGSPHLMNRRVHADV